MLIRRDNKTLEIGRGRHKEIVELELVHECQPEGYKATLWRIPGMEVKRIASKPIFDLLVMELVPLETVPLVEPAHEGEEVSGISLVGYDGDESILFWQHDVTYMKERETP